MKNYIIVAAITSILLVPALFADTTGTGTTTSTAITSTGTTGTGTTGTGVQCNTGTMASNQAALLVAQKTFSTEIARLVAQKQTAYTASLSLTGTLRTDAIRTMNTQFKTGFMTAIKTLNTAKKSHHSDAKECRKEMKQDKKEDRREYREDKKERREEIKSQIKDLKDRIKEIRKNNKD